MTQPAKVVYNEINAQSCCFGKAIFPCAVFCYYFSFDNCLGGASFEASNSYAFFHAKKVKPQQASSVVSSPTPSPKPQRGSGQPGVFAKFFKNVGASIASTADLLWPFEDLVGKKGAGQASNVSPSPKSLAKGQVLGTSDKVNGSGIGQFFKNVWGGIAAVLDFLWPFEDWGKSDKNKTGLATTNNPIETTQSPSPEASPTTLAQTGETSLEVVENQGVSTQVVVTDTVEDLTVTDELTVNGKTTLGDTSSDRIFLKGLLGSDVLVDTSKAYNIGSGGGRFKTGYFSDNIYIGEENRLGADGMNVKGSMYLNTRSGGSIYLDADSGTVYLGEGTNKLANADNDTALTIDPAGSGRVQFHSSSNFIDSSGNMTIVGTLTQTGGGGSSSDSVDITPATNIDALDITGTNINTADLIDLDATATTTGDAIDINMANTRTSGSAILITDESVAATVTGDLIQINVTGTPDTNTLDIDVSAAASGNMIDLTSTDVVYTGNMIDINAGNAAQTGDAINISMGAGAVGFQGLVMTTSAGIRTASAIALTENNTTGTVPTIQYDSAQTRGGVMDINLTGILATENAINIDASAAFTSNLLNFNTTAASSGNVIGVTTATAASSGNLIDLNFGNIADTGDAVNISMGAAAVGAQGLVMTTSAGIRTASAIDITENNTTGTVASIAYTSAQTRGGIMDLNLTGALGTENAIDIDTTAAFTSNLIDITTATAASSGNMIDLNFGAVADTGDAINVALGATAVAAQALVVSATGASSTDGWVLAADNTGDGVWTGDMMNFRTGTGDASGDIIDITMEAGATDAQAFVVANAAASDQAGWLMKVDTTGIFTTNMFDIDLGAQASTGDILNVSMGSTNIAGGVLVVADAGGVRTDAIIDITSASTATTDAGSIMQINGTGALAGANVLDINVSGGSTSGNVIDITTSATLTASNLIDLNFGAIADTGDAINIAMGSTAVGAQALVVASSGVSTVDLIDISSTGVVTTAQDLMQLAYTAGDGTDVTQSVLHTQLTTSGAGLAATDIAAGILVEQVAEAGSGTERGIMFSGAWDAEIYLQNTETISNVTDDSIVLTGAGGTNNESFTIDLDSVASSGATLSSGGSYVLVNDNLSVGIDGNTTENIASSDFAFSGNDLYVDDKLGVNGTASIDGNLWQGDAVTTTTKTTAFLFLGTTAGAPTGDPSTPAGFAGLVYDTTNNKLCTEEEAAGAAWLCTAALTDIAEWMPAAGAESGDLVSVTDLANPVDDPTAPFMLAKTTKPYDNKLIGVVSKYAEDAESAQGYKLSPDYHAVTLVGRVPVKVSGENGPIARGDYLTSSSTPGYAMKATKAGPVAGMALEPFDEDKGTIIVFIKAAWFDPVEEQKRAVLAALGLGSGSVLGASTTSGVTDPTAGGVTGATNPLVGAVADGSLGVLEEAVDLLVHGLLTANNLRVTTAAEFGGTLVVKGLATFEGDLVVKGGFATGTLELSGALVKVMTAGSDISAGDPVIVSGANTVVRAGSADANVVGLAAADAAAGSTVRVALSGTVGGYSGLSIGSRYYLGDGGVVTTAPPAGATKAVHVGIAVSSSEMIVQLFEGPVTLPEPPVFDEATVDTGPSVAVVDNNTVAPTEPTPVSSTEPQAASPSPAPTPSPEPSATPTPSPTPSPVSQ